MRIGMGRYRVVPKVGEGQQETVDAPKSASTINTGTTIQVATTAMVVVIGPGGNFALTPPPSVADHPELREALAA